MQVKAVLVRQLINVTAYIAPSVSAYLSYQLWTSTRRYKMPEKERQAFNSAQKEKIVIDDANIMVYTWRVEKSRPLVLLLHGWNGRGTQLSAFVSELTEAGYGVVTFDARGHGLSDGRHTNIMESVAIVKEIGRIYGDFAAMIAHSFGSMVAVNAIYAGVACEKFIGISPPADFSALLAFFCDAVKLNKKARRALEKRVLANYNIASFIQISITGIAPYMRIPCLIIHDKNDDKVPLSHAKTVVALWGKKAPWRQPSSGAKLLVTEGLGHVRILHKPPVLKAMMAFIQESRVE